MDFREGLAGIPQKEGISERFMIFLGDEDSEETKLLKELFTIATGRYGFDPDTFVHEITEAVVGDQYPVPDRILASCNAFVHDYLIQEMCNNQQPDGKYDLFATEGGTAAMCYIFDSLMQNFLLKKGDKVALFVPVFTPYIEIPELDRYDFKVVHINATGRYEDGNHKWDYPDSELEKLRDKDIKVAFLVNPSNPPSYALTDRERNKIISIIRNHNPDLMFITDDVYGTFVDGFRSLMAEIPYNTLGVYSYSKYFGCTGWRLGVIALHEQNVFDKKIKSLPKSKQDILNKRYASINLHPDKLKFIDRMVADSRSVALNHTAGLSLPQQAQMMLFSAFALFDKKNSYKKLTQQIISKRYALLFEGLGAAPKEDPNRAGYYAEIDLMAWAIKHHGKAFADYLKKNYEPVDVLFRLAELHSVVLLNGGGFDGPEWSVRVSLANLDDNAYKQIGSAIEKIAQEYVAAWKSSGM